MLPRIIAPPVFLFFWALLIILTLAGVVAWLGQIPLYVTGTGVVLDKNTFPDGGRDEAVAVVLLTATEASKVHAGFSAQVSIGSTGPQLMRTIDFVSPGILSPDEVHRRYGIEMSDPSRLVSLKLGHDISRLVYAGSPVRVQIQVGSRRLLSLFPIFNTLWKEA
ncbi:MAG: hypothetical protein NVS2B12_35830 [Ktedonobacteraceae bacterium]